MSGLSLKAKKKEAAIEMILKAAEELWLEEDCLEPSMASLAKHAGIAVGTLYNYFSDQEALTTALVQSRLAQVNQAIFEELKSSEGSPFEERLKGLLKILLQDRSSVSNGMRLLQILGANNSAAHLRKKSFPALTEMILQFGKFLKEGAAEGVLSKKNQKLQIIVLMGLIRTLLIAQVTEKISASDAQEIVARSFLDGHRMKS